MCLSLSVYVSLVGSCPVLYPQNVCVSVKLVIPMLTQTHISHGDCETNVAVKQGNLNCISVMIGAFLNNNERFFFCPCLCCIKGHSVFLMGILSGHVFVVMF